MEQLDLHGQPVQLGLVGLGLAVPVDKSHGLAHAHLLSLGPGHIQDAGLTGQRLLLPDQQTIGLHAVVDCVGVGQSGGEGVVKGVKDVVAKVDGQRPGDEDHHQRDDRFSLLHGYSLFLYSVPAPAEPRRTRNSQPWSH